MSKQAEGKKAKSRNARHRQAVGLARQTNNATPNGFVEWLAEKKNNPFAGKTIKEILDDDAYNFQYGRKIVNDANLHGRGDPRLNEYRLALSKAKKIIVANISDAALRGKVSLLTDTEFRTILDLDDPFSMIAAGASAAYGIYKSNPAIKEFIDTAISRGYEKVKHFFTGAPSGRLNQNPNDLRLDQTGKSARAVNIDYTFGRLTELLPGASSPSDIPKMMYTNQASGEFSIQTNTSGNLVLSLNGNGFNGVTTGSAGIDWLCYCAVAAYDPGSSVAPAAADVANSGSGPFAPNAGLAEKWRVLGFEVTVTPTVSNDSSQGSYCCGFFQSETANTPLWQTGMSYDYLSQMSGMVTSDMKSVTYSRSFDTGTFANSGAAPNAKQTLMFALMVAGAASKSRLSIRWSLTYTLMPSRAGELVVRGSIPAMGPYTMAFNDYLRVTFPGIVHWPPADIVRLYQKCKACGTDDYDELVNCMNKVALEMA